MRRLARAALLLSVFSIFKTPPGYAGTIGVQAAPKNTEIVLAEPTEITFTIRLPLGLKLDLSQWKAGQTQWGDFTLWDFKTKLSKDGDLSVTELNVFVMAFKLGRVEFPALEIPTQAQDQEPVIIKTPPLPLTILDPSQNSKDSSAPRDIKPPRKPLYFWEHPWVIGPLILTLLATTILAWFWWRSRRRRKSIDESIQSALSPEEMFELEIKKLMESNFLSTGEFRQFHFGLSFAFRNYLDRRFSLDTQSLTSSELLRLLHQNRQTLEIELSVLIKIKESLEISDLAKFAKYSPSSQENDRSINILKEFVSTHRPMPLPPEPTEKSKISNPKNLLST